MRALTIRKKPGLIKQLENRSRRKKLEKFMLQKDGDVRELASRWNDFHFKEDPELFQSAVEKRKEFYAKVNEISKSKRQEKRLLRYLRIDLDELHNLSFFKECIMLVAITAPFYLLVRATAENKLDFSVPALSATISIVILGILKLASFVIYKMHKEKKKELRNTLNSLVNEIAQKLEEQQ